MNKLEKNKQRVIDLLKSTKREGIDGLVDFLCESDFFTAPASTRLDYHGCHEGGLAEHSLNVYDALEAKAKQYDLGLRDDERTIASLCHDLCKVGIYAPNYTEKGNRSQSKPYVIEEPFPLGHGEKSAYVAGTHIKLTQNEALLIRWHMGSYDREWENYSDKVTKACPAIHALHCADIEASNYLDAKLRKK